MNLQSNIQTIVKSPKRQFMNDASALVDKRSTQIQSILDLPHIFLITNASKSPPGRWCCTPINAKCL